MILPENNENMKIVDLKAIHSEVLQNGLNKNYFQTLANYMKNDRDSIEKRRLLLKTVAIDATRHSRRR